MSFRKIAWWLPRLVVLGCVAAVILPGPGYIDSLGRDEFLVWLLRAAWVLLLSLGLGLMTLAAGRLISALRRTRPGKADQTGTGSSSGSKQAKP